MRPCESSCMPDRGRSASPSTKDRVHGVLGVHGPGVVTLLNLQHLKMIMNLGDNIVKEAEKP